MVYMYHSFLIHSSADGHLGCFHVLAAMNIGSFLHIFIHSFILLVRWSMLFPINRAFVFHIMYSFFFLVSLTVFLIRSYF